MKNLDVLLLGWEFPPLTEGESGVACYELAKELASQVNLSLILPKTDPDFVLQNVELTGLNNINLQPTPAPVTKPVVNAFAEPRIVQSDIKLYGAPTYTGQEQIETPAYEQPGEAASVGELGASTPTTTETYADNNTSSVEQLNIFGETDLSKIDYNSQVIHYARYATRLASQKNFDIIYAYDWMTYLAAVELKLISGKLLVVHVQSLSDDRGGPDCKGWMYEMEKQALEKADFIITYSDELVTQIEADYNIAPSKIRSINKLDEPLSAEITGAVEEPEEEPETTLTASVTGLDSVESTAVTTPVSLDWEEAANNVVSVFQQLLESTKATK